MTKYIPLHIGVRGVTIHVFVPNRHGTEVDRGAENVA